MDKFSRALTDAELTEIMRLPQQDQGQAYVLVSESRHPIENLREQIAEVKKWENHPSAFISVDERSEHDFSLEEHIASADPTEMLDGRREQHRVESFDVETEQVLTVVSKPGKDLANLAKCCVRYIKYERVRLREEYAGNATQIPLFRTELKGVLA